MDNNEATFNCFPSFLLVLLIKIFFPFHFSRFLSIYSGGEPKKIQGQYYTYYEVEEEREEEGSIHNERLKSHPWLLFKYL